MQGPIESIHLREVRFMGDWRALAQIINSTTTRKLPVAVEGVRVSLRNAECIMESTRHSDPKTNGSKMTDEAVNFATARAGNARLTWVGLLRATICWNVITMTEVTVTDIVVDAHDTHRCALVVQRVAMYSLRVSSDSSASSDGSSDNGEFGDERARIALYTSSVRLKAIDEPYVDSVQSTDREAIVESPTLPSVADLESASITVAIEMHGQRIAVDKLVVEPNSLDVKLGVVSMMMFQRMVLNRRRGNFDDGGGYKRHTRHRQNTAIFGLPIRTVDFRMNDMRVRVLGEMFPKKERVHGQQQRTLRPVLSMKSVFVNIDRGGDSNGGGDGGSSGNYNEPNMAFSSPRKSRFAWSCYAGWTSMDISDWSSSMSADEGDSDATTSTLFAVGRTSAATCFESESCTSIASISGTARIGDIHANFIGWRCTVSQLYTRCCDVCNTGLHVVPEEVTPPDNANEQVRREKQEETEDIMGTDARSANENGDDGVRGRSGENDGVAVHITCDFGNIQLKTMIGEGNHRGALEPDLGMSMMMHSGSIRIEKSDDMLPPRATLKVSKLSTGLLRRIRLNRPSSPSKASSPPSSSLPAKSSREGSPRLCRFLESEILSLKSAVVDLEHGDDAQDFVDTNGRSTSSDSSSSSSRHARVQKVSVIVEDVMVVVRSREITEETIGAVQSSLHMLQSNAVMFTRTTSAATMASGTVNVERKRAKYLTAGRSIELTLTNSVVIFDTASAMDIAAGGGGYVSTNAKKRKCALRIAQVCVTKMQPRHVRVVLSALAVEDRGSPPSPRAVSSGPSVVSIQELAFEKLDVHVTNQPESRASIEINHAQMNWDMETHIMLLAVYDVLERARRIARMHVVGKDGSGKFSSSFTPPTSSSSSSSSSSSQRKLIFMLQLHDVFAQAKIEDNMTMMMSSSSPPSSTASPSESDVVAVALDFYSSHDISRECEADNLKILVNDEKLVEIKTLSYGPHASSTDFNGERVMTHAGLFTPVKTHKKRSNDDRSASVTPNTNESIAAGELERQHSFPQASTAAGGSVDDASMPNSRPHAAFVHHQRSASNAELRYASARARSKVDDFSASTGTAKVVQLEMMDVNVTVPSGVVPGILVTNVQLMVKALQSLRQTASGVCSPERIRAGVDTSSRCGDVSTATTSNVVQCEFEIRVVVQSFSFVAHHDKFEAWLRTRQGHLGKIVAENIARCDALSRSVGTMEVQMPSDASDDVWVRNGSFNSSSAVRELKMHMLNEYIDAWKTRGKSAGGNNSTSANRILFRLDMKIIELIMIRPVLRAASDVSAFVADMEEGSTSSDANSILPELENGGSLWCMDVSVSDLSANVCDTPLPLISSSSMTLSGAFAIYRQGGVCAPVCVTRNIAISENRSVSLSVPKAGARPPLKFSSHMSLKLQQPAMNFTVGMEPYLADLQQVIDRLIPKSPGMIPASTPPKRFPWFDRLRYLWRGKLDITLSSASVKLYAVASSNVRDDNPHVGIKLGTFSLGMEPNRHRLSFTNMTVTASRPVKVDCEIDMQCLRRQFQYNIVLSECPSVEVDVIYDWTLCVQGRSTRDHFLHGKRGAHPMRANANDESHIANGGKGNGEGGGGNLLTEAQDALILHDEYRSVNLRLNINVNFGEERRTFFDSSNAEEDVHNGPVFRLGAADVEWLREFGALLCRPPPGLRNASKRKRFGKSRMTFSGDTKGLGQLMSAVDVNVTSVGVQLVNRAERDGDPADKMTLTATSVSAGVTLSRSIVQPLPVQTRTLSMTVEQQCDNKGTLHTMPACEKRNDNNNDSSSSVAQDGDEESNGTRPRPEKLMTSEKGPTTTDDLQNTGLKVMNLHVKMDEPCLHMAASSKDVSGEERRRSHAERDGTPHDFDADCFIGSALSVELSRDLTARGKRVEEECAESDSALRVVVDGLKLFVTRDSRDAVFTCIVSYLDKLRRSATVRHNHSASPGRPHTATLDANANGKVDSSTQPIDAVSEDGTPPPALHGTKSDLLKLLLGNDTSDESPDMNSHNPLTEQLQLLLDIRNPQFYFQSHVSSGRFLLAAAGGLVVGRELHGSDGREKRAYTISLSQVQGHVAPTESLTDRSLEWITEDALVNGTRSVDLKSRSLKQVFEPFALQLHVSRIMDDGHLRYVPTDETATQEINLSTPSVQARMDSRQYAVFMDVVSNLLLAPMPAPRHSSDMIPRALPNDPKDVQNARAAAIGYHQEAAELINMCAQLRGVDGCSRALEAKMTQARLGDGRAQEVTLDEFIAGDSGGIEGRPYWWALRSTLEDLESALVEQWHETRRKAAVATADLREMIAAAKRSGARASSKLDVKVDRVAWDLIGGGGGDESLVEAVIHDLAFTKMRREDSSGLTRFAVSETAVKTPDREIISMWHPPGLVHDEKGFLRIYAVQAVPTDGIATYDHFEFGIHPTSVQISGPLLQRLWEYFFPRDSFGDDRRGGATDTPVKSRHRRRGSRLLGGRDLSGNYDSIGSDHSSPSSSFDDNDPTRSHGHFNVSMLQRPLPDPGHTPLRPPPRRGRHRRVGSWDGVMIEMKDPVGTTSSVVDKTVTTKQHLRAPGRRVSEFHVGSHSKSKSAIPTHSGFVSSSSSSAAIAKLRAPKIRITYMRFNECHIMMSYEGNPISFNRPLVLDARTYNFFEGQWRDFINKLKWDVIRSVLKSVTGFQGRKLKDLELQTSDLMHGEQQHNDNDVAQSSQVATVEEGSKSMVVYLENGPAATDGQRVEDTATPTRGPSHKRTASGKINPVRRLFRGRRSATTSSFDARDTSAVSSGVASIDAATAAGSSEPLTPVQTTHVRSADSASGGTPHSSLVLSSEEMKASMLGLRPMTKEKNAK